jgi:transcription initiation factor IIE alpha subunit
VANQDLLILKDFITFEDEEFYISTLQMQVRHSWQTQDEEIFVFETMVFRVQNKVIDYHASLFHRRYRTVKEARDGHAQTLKNLEKIIFTCSKCHYKYSYDS